MKLAHVTIRKNKDGSPRYYFRRRGQPIVRLPDNPQSPEFMRSYNAQLNWYAPKRIEKMGTFEWLCDEYMNTLDFKNKSENTRKPRARIMQSMCNEFIDPDHPETFGEEKVLYFTRQHIEVLVQRKSDAPNAANTRLVVLNQLFKLAVSRGYSEFNPCNDVERISISSEGHRTATDENLQEFEAYHRNNPEALFALFLARKTGARASDLRLLGKQHLRGNVLTFRTMKTNRLCELTMDEESLAILKARPGMTFILTNEGIPYQSEKAMSARFSKWFKQAGIEDITSHSVRKWLATKMADQGANEFELMAWFGWSDPKEARPYVERVNRLKLAKKAGEKVQHVTAYRD